MANSRIHHFYMYIGDKRKIMENVGPLQKEMGDLVTQDVGKAQVVVNDKGS